MHIRKWVSYNKLVFIFVVLFFLSPFFKKVYFQGIDAVETISFFLEKFCRVKRFLYLFFFAAKLMYYFKKVQLAT